MGHKPSSAFNGARGIVRATDAQLEQDLVDGAQSAVVELAAQHRPLAIQTLHDCMTNPEAPWSSRVSAATNMLAYSDGKPASQKQNEGGGGTVFNLQIVQYGAPDQELPVKAIEVVAEVVGSTPSEVEELLGGVL